MRQHQLRQQSFDTSHRLYRSVRLSHINVKSQEAFNFRRQPENRSKINRKFSKKKRKYTINLLHERKWQPKTVINININKNTNTNTDTDVNRIFRFMSSLVLYCTVLYVVSTFLPFSLSLTLYLMTVSVCPCDKQTQTDAHVCIQTIEMHKVQRSCAAIVAGRCAFSIHCLNISEWWTLVYAIFSLVQFSIRSDRQMFNTSHVYFANTLIEHENSKIP